jgi:hypothetical protein
MLTLRASKGIRQGRQTSLGLQVDPICRLDDVIQTNSLPRPLYLTGSGFQVSGIDLIPEAIAQARKIATDLDLDIPYPRTGAAWSSCAGTSYVHRWPRADCSSSMQRRWRLP